MLSVEKAQNDVGSRPLQTAEIMALLQKKKRKKNWIVLTVIFVALCLAIGAGWAYHRIQKIELRQRGIRKTLKTINFASTLTPRLGKAAIPARFVGVPFGEDLGTVLDVKEVDIRGVVAPYNPGLLPSPTGYDLFFRYDVFNPKLKHASFSSRIGVVSLDREFKQKETEFKRIDLGSPYADDPRVMVMGDQLYLFYNRLDEINPKCRFMCVANLDPVTYKMNYNTILDLNLHWVEKNWNPFEYIGPNQERRLFLEYRINPRKLLELPDPHVNDLKNVTLPAVTAYLDLVWPGKWGEISGGTPPILMDSEYLGFFHSWFTDENKAVWYVMGAYTFEAAPPFEITGISRFPILFKGIYETPLINTASNNKRVIFPSGVAIEKKEGKDLIHVACGENDSGIKIVTLDKEKLISSMTRFETKE